MIRASIRTRESLQNRIRDNPTLAKLANMGAAKPLQQLHGGARRSSRRVKAKPVIDPETGLYLNKEKPSIPQAIKRARALSNKNIPLAVRHCR